MLIVIKTREQAIITNYIILQHSLPFFTELHKQWYLQRDGKNIKIVPKQIGKLLTARALAYWIAGDGCFINNKVACYFVQTPLLRLRLTSLGIFFLKNSVLTLLVMRMV
jgi:hypothetical protein